MSKIPKKIVDMIEQRNKLNKEISNWCNENLEIEGMEPDFADITDYYTGSKQYTTDRKEWCEQHEIYEDYYTGHYYWETAYPNKFLHMQFNT